MRLTFAVLLIAVTFTGKAAAQTVIASTGKAVAQTATLENLALMEALRDSPPLWGGGCGNPNCQSCANSCGPIHNAWLLGYGFGGFARERNENRFCERPDDCCEDEYPTVSPLRRYDQRAGGFLLAVDRQWACDRRCGLFFSYNNTKLGSRFAFPDFCEETDECDECNETGKCDKHRRKNHSLHENVETNNFFWGGYTRLNAPYGYFMSSIAGGYSHLHETRRFLFAPAPDPENTLTGHADTGAWRALVYGEIGTEYCIPMLSTVTTFTPFWGLQYYYSRYVGTEEDLTFYGLCDTGTLSRLRTNSFRNILGLRIRHPMLPAFRTEVTLDFTAYWVHEFLNMSQLGGITSQYFQSTAPYFQVTEHAPAIYSGRDWAILSPVLHFNLGRVKLWAGYMVMFNANETINMGLAGGEFTW